MRPRISDRFRFCMTSKSYPVVSFKTPYMDLPPTITGVFDIFRASHIHVFAVVMIG
jgi:hypothetical protein